MTRRRDITDLLKFLVCVVLVGGLVMQICMLAAIHSRTKETASINQELKYITAERDNYDLKLANLKTRENVESRAIALGMQWPTAEQLRIISIPAEYQDTSTHTAEIADVQ